jgi:hypothetical protein
MLKRFAVANMMGADETIGGVEKIPRGKNGRR